jgi:hypothetical protein
MLKALMRLALYLAGAAAVCGQGILITDGDIVRKDGAVARMTHQEAMDYCKAQGGHLASTREFVSFMNPDAILELDQIVDGKVPPGYYKVACMDEFGQADTFYYNNSVGRTGQKPRRLSGDLAKYAFWCSSLVLGNKDYAHVFYGPLGGGGGAPEDHKRTKLHAAILLKNR